VGFWAGSVSGDALAAGLFSERPAYPPSPVQGIASDASSSAMRLRAFLVPKPGRRWRLIVGQPMKTGCRLRALHCNIADGRVRRLWCQSQQYRAGFVEV